MPFGRQRRTSISQICQWEIDSWNDVKEETVERSFKKSGISNAMNGTEDNLISMDNQKMMVRRMLLLSKMVQTMMMQILQERRNRLIKMMTRMLMMLRAWMTQKVLDDTNNSIQMKLIGNK